jgi:hypothetical protein
MWSFDDLRSAARAGFEISQGESAMRRREQVQEHRFSPELIAAVESAFFPGEAPHETKIIRILAAVVPVVRQECGADIMRDALERISTGAPGVKRLPPWAIGLANAALAKARGEG